MAADVGRGDHSVARSAEPQGTKIADRFGCAESHSILNLGDRVPGPEAPNRAVRETVGPVRPTKELRAMTQQIRKVAVLGGNRIPFARSNTAYSHASNQD